MTPEETKEYHLSRAVTLPNMIRLHGEIDGPILYKSYCDKQITAGNTLESFIAKYPGDVEKGKAHYEAMLFKKTQGSKNNNPNSKVSMELFESILITYTKSVFYGKNEKTVNFKANNNRAKPYKPDFINLEDKKIIEFFGDYWHANPRKYKANDLIRRKETTAEMIWEKDRDKLNLMKDAGYEVLVIWEYDYNHDKAGTVVKCLEFLNS